MADFTLDDIKQRSMAEITAMQARRHGEKTFLHFLPRDERISYAGFDRRSSAVGRGLKAHGVQAGAHVGLILDNCPEMILAVFALAKIGAVWVPINTAAKGKLLVYYLDFADITTLIVHEKYLAPIAACLHELPRLQRIVVVDDGSGHAAQQAPGPSATPRWSRMAARTRRSTPTPGSLARCCSRRARRGRPRPSCGRRRG